jgi:ABC-type amino acid transport substrate-binding protein
MVKKACCLAALLIGILSAATNDIFPETITVTIPKPRGQSGSTTLFNKQILTLALDKTKNDFGGYVIAETPLTMNTSRAIHEIRENTYTNLMLLTSFQNRFIDEGLDYTRFPVDLGVTGYRIGFVSAAARSKFKSVSSLADLKKISIVQGAGWADTVILRSNGLTVTELSAYDSPFLMIATGRAEYFPRGINEIESEADSAGRKNYHLEIDREIALEYDLPRFFFSNKKNKNVLDRITKGLVIAYNDGSFQKIWNQHFGDAVKFADLRHRRIIRLTNTNISRINFNYRKYYIIP